MFATSGQVNFASRQTVSQFEIIHLLLAVHTGELVENFADGIRKRQPHEEKNDRKAKWEKREVDGG